MKKENRTEGKIIEAGSREEALKNDNAYSVLCCGHLLKMNLFEWKCLKTIESDIVKVGIYSASVISGLSLGFGPTVFWTHHFIQIKTQDMFLHG